MSAPKQASHGGARPGAGRKPNASKGLDVRERQIGVRLSEAEYLALEAQADAEGVAVSDLVRERALFPWSTLAVADE